MYASKGSFEVKLLTRGTDGKAETGRVREEQRRSKKIREEKGSEERRCRRAKKVEQSRSTVCWQWSVAPEGRKVGLLRDTDTNDTHYTTRHYTTRHHTPSAATTATTTTTVHYSIYTSLQECHDTTRRDSTTHATVQDTTVRDTTAHCTHEATPQRLQLHHTNYTTAQVQLHYATTSFKPSICLPCCTAGCQLACFRLAQLGSKGQNTMAVKDGSGPRPAAQRAKRCFLNFLESSFKPSIQN